MSLIVVGRQSKTILHMHPIKIFKIITTIMILIYVTIFIIFWLIVCAKLF